MNCKEVVGEGVGLNNAQDCDTTDPSPTPVYFVWLGLDMKSTLVKVRGRLWFCLKVNKHIVSAVTVNSLLLSQTTVFL